MTLHQDDDLLRRVRSLDPTLHERHDDPPSARAMLARIRQGDAVSAHSTTVPRAARLRAARWRGPVAMLATAAALAAISAGAVVALRPGSHDSTTGTTASGTTASAVALPPLVPTDAREDCTGTAPIPVSKLSAPGGAENGDSPESQGLRHFLAHGTSKLGDGQFSKTNWALLSETGTAVTFGQRVGAIGVNRVLTLKRHGDAFTIDSTGGCGTVVLSNGNTTESIEVATPVGRTLHLLWPAGGSPRMPDRLVVRTETQETPVGVHVLIITKPNPAIPPLKPGEMRPLPAFSQSTTVTLSTPLHGRPVIDDSVIPARSVRSGPTQSPTSSPR